MYVCMYLQLFQGSISFKIEGDIILIYKQLKLTKISSKIKLLEPFNQYIFKSEY